MVCLPMLGISNGRTMSRSLMKDSARLLLGLTALLVFRVENATAILRRPDREDANYLALAERFPAVCLVCADGVAAGSGTLIASRWVLTAGHVVDPWNLTSAGQWVKSKANHQWSVLFGKHENRVKRVIEYPGYSCKEGGTDLALLELDTPVDSVVPISIFVDENEMGKTITLVGFGVTGTFETGPPQGAEAVKFSAIPARMRAKRAGTNVIISVSHEDLETRIDPLESATDLEASIAGGDSGGPALVQVGGQMYVAGVISSGPHRPPSEDPAGVYGDRVGFVRVSSFARWVEDTTSEDFGVVRVERMAVVSGLVLLMLFAASVWYTKHFVPSLNMSLRAKRLLTPALVLIVTGVVIWTGCMARLDATSRAVLAFVPAVMTLTAIGVRYAAGTFRGKASKQTFYFVLRVLVTVPVVAMAGLVALFATRQVKVAGFLGLWPAAFAVGAFITCAVEATPFVAKRWKGCDPVRRDSNGLGSQAAQSGQ